MDKRVLTIAIGVTVAAAFFAIDVLFPHEFIGRIPYYFVVLAAWWSPKRNDVWLFAVVAGNFTILGNFIPSGDASTAGGEPQRAVALFGIAVVSGLIFHGKRATEDHALRALNEQLEKRVADRTEELIQLNEDLQKEIASRKEADTVIHESEERYRKLVEQSPEGIIVHDGKAILFANQTAVRLFGASGMDEMLRITPINLYCEENRSDILEKRKKVLQEGQIFTNPDTVLKRIDGGEFMAKWFAAAVPWNGRPAVQLVFQDITERKQAEIALRDAKENAERADYSKSRFLAAASHDLRQPIQALNLFVYSLSQLAKGNPEIEEIVGDIRLSTQIMSGLLNALLDISKLDAGMIDPEVEEFPIESVLDDVSNTFLGQAREKGIDLRVVTSSEIVTSDPTLVQRVINNYVSNAVRYTDSGRILLGCRKKGNKLRIEVWDTGPGIPESELAKIFEEFYQLDNPGRDRSLGLGLGLAIVQRTADLIGLEFGLNSVPGKGSVFWLAAPLSQDSAFTEAETVSPQTAGSNSGNIVLIEDDALVLRSLGDILLSAGYEVIGAESAHEALANLREFSITPDLVIANHRLGVKVKELEAIALLKNEFGKNVPSIIITGDTALDRRREASEGGHVLLHKPVSPEVLLDTVSQVIHRQGNLVFSS